MTRIREGWHKLPSYVKHAVSFVGGMYVVLVGVSHIADFLILGILWIAFILLLYILSFYQKKEDKFYELNGHKSYHKGLISFIEEKKKDEK